uniref:CUB domain-containing protein n=1 Tax=Panagrolaimus sp. PS1159 TaxID=55785 RepID=A0AC35EVK1_9BILA
MHVEDGVDKIVFHEYINGKPVDFTTQQVDYGFYTVFSAIDNETERNIFWEFTTDGSVQSHGFEIRFEKKYCSCGDPIVIVPCHSNKKFYLMNDLDDYYCGNLECNFTIKLNESCKFNFIVFDYEITEGKFKHDSTFDVLRIISNNGVLFEYKNSYASNLKDTILIPASNQNILQAITSMSSFAKNATFKVYARNGKIIAIFCTFGSLSLSGYTVSQATRL